MLLQGFPGPHTAAGWASPSPPTAEEGMGGCQPGFPHLKLLFCRLYLGTATWLLTKFLIRSFFFLGSPENIALLLLVVAT